MSTSLRSWIAVLAILLHFFCLCTASSNQTNFTIVNGQVFTPGLAIIDAPQPFTPEGGDFLQVAIDISGDGQLRVGQPDNFTQIFNITIFLTSYDRGHNFTISNATGPLPPLTDIMSQESGSTVKHVNWEWPLCLAGVGGTKNDSDARGSYNISIHQNFRLNGSNFYTIFDLPIEVTNSIPLNPSSGQNGNKPAPGPMNGFNGRVSCELLENPLISDEERRNSTNNPAVQPFIGGPVTVQSNNKASGNTSDASIHHQSAMLLAASVSFAAVVIMY